MNKFLMQIVVMMLVAKSINLVIKNKTLKLVIHKVIKIHQIVIKTLKVYIKKVQRQIKKMITKKVSSTIKTRILPVPHH